MLRKSAKHQKEPALNTYLSPPLDILKGTGGET